MERSFGNFVWLTLDLGGTIILTVLGVVTVFWVLGKLFTPKDDDNAN